MTSEEKERRKATQRKYAKTLKGKALFLHKAYRSIDAKKGRECDLTQERIMEIMNLPCTYCGQKEEQRGCDRIDNKRGHCFDNVVPCCYVCNSARMNNFSHEEMFEIGAVIAKVKMARKTRPIDRPHVEI